MSYHKFKIHKHHHTSVFKIQEEFYEYLDAVATNNPIMAIQELSDIYGCLEREASKYMVSMDNLKTMSDLTSQVFKSGGRESEPFIKHLKKNCDFIKTFSLGFIQVKCGDFNYNFYTDKVDKFENYEAPHNHRQDFVSEILKGSLMETIYQVSDGDFEGFCGCGDSNKVIKYSYEEVKTITHKAGDYYLRQKNEYHSVLATNNTVTKVFKMGNKVDAFVLSENRDEGIGQTFSEDELWSIVEEVWNV